jgi:NitT/TauT family transport system permease protein
MATKSIKKILKIISPLICILVLLIIWELIVRLFRIHQYLLPAPSAIGIDFIMNFRSLLFHAGVTFWEAFWGFLIANGLGFLVAVCFAHSKTLERGLYPLAIALKTTPIIAMAPLLILWFGNGFASKIAAAALISFFPVIVNATKGLKTINENALNLFRSLSATKWQIFIKLRLPSALPYIFSALKISASLAVVGAVVGEFVGANKGIGFIILLTGYQLETVQMFSAITMAALLGIFFFTIVSVLEKRLVSWSKIED